MDHPRIQFPSETSDLIEQVFAALDELHHQPNRVRQRELIDDIFRRVHRIKGSAASFGFTGLAEIAHEFEHLLSAMRSEQITLDETVIETCENATTALSESLTLAESGVIEPSRRELFESIRALAPTTPTDQAYEATLATILSQLPVEQAQALTVEEKRRLARRQAEGNSLCLVTIGFDVSSLEEQFYSFKEKLAELGEVIATSPAVDAKQTERVNFRILVSSGHPAQALQDYLQKFSNVAISQLVETTTSVPREPDDTHTAPRLSSSLATNFIRTDLNDLDQILSATHELFRRTTAALDRTQHLFGKDEQQSDFESEAREIRRSFLQVQNELINLRMVSLGPILQRATRAGRAAARLIDKQVEFEIIGSDLRLDKMLCDAIADPLVHLVRNAIDHGIEPGDVREAAGKPARGKVTIEAVRFGSRTRLRVSDDGRGIDPPTIGSAARELGIINHSTTIDMNRSLRLIFRPGFSTMPSASTVSGRGVGLDIVETAVEQVGGEVRVSSEPGQGSIFEIRLPVTFSLLDSTIVTVGENSYCLASSDVVRTELMAASKIETSDQRDSLLTTDGTLPLVHLRDVLGDPEASVKEDVSVVTCELPLSGKGERGELLETRQGKKLIGLVVEKVLGREEVLVRNLGRHAGRWYGVAGATELRDGTVALVLDLPRLLANSKKNPQ